MVRTFEPTNIHAAKLIDLPLVRRLTEDGIVLDSELVCTREALGATTVLLSRILPQRGVYTLVGRSGREKVVGQFRLRGDHPLAQMIFVAPSPQDEVRTNAWLHLLDAVAAEAGKRGAHMLMAEVDEDSLLFNTLRLANFAVYARQELWRWQGDAERLAAVERLPLTEVKDEDPAEIHSLYSAVVPPLIQPVAAPSEDAAGWVYRRDGRIRAYIAYAEGRCGGYIMPYVHPEVVAHEADALFSAVLARAKADRQPVFLCLRRYQEWLETSLHDLGFVPFKEQAVMVRHIAAGVRHAQFVQTGLALEAISHVVRPPSHSKMIPMPSGEVPRALWNDGSQTI
ncbi:MAG: hypothetical protein L6Q98_15765 [Anaerolineae bacterium]|nr:hypothetical protein [Anaerolineae bacterium]NUQ06952.1 hypothetical protein [Anaerolineae bacterium]